MMSRINARKGSSTNHKGYYSWRVVFFALLGLLLLIITTTTTFWRSDEINLDFASNNLIITKKKSDNANKENQHQNQNQNDQQQQQKQQQQQHIQEQPRASATAGDDPVLQELQLSMEEAATSIVRHLDDSSNDNEIAAAAVQQQQQQQQQQQPVVYFLNHSQVTNKDSFSASWLQSKQDFLQMDLTQVGICEDASFKAWNTRKDKLRMTLDYFDFSVEHLSKWWKLLDYHEHDMVYNSIIAKLEAYVERGNEEQYFATVGQEPVILEQTLAGIAFQPYNAPQQSQSQSQQQLLQERAYNLTITSLAATIESLRRAEMGRVVVLGSEQFHHKVVQDAFAYLAKHLPQLTTVQVSSSSDSERSSSKGTNITKIGHMELGFAQATKAQLKTKSQSRNMPYGVLSGSRKAFVLADKDPATRTKEESIYLQQWMGTTRDPTFWNYLYLTEPDSILTTRTTALSQIKEEIDLRGGIVAPFRLQPIPHESDISGYPLTDRFLPEADWPVMELDHFAPIDNNNNNKGKGKFHRDVCCDEYKGPDHRPGRSHFPMCNIRKWFLCGFETKVPTEDPHRRLKPYKLFRLTKGTGLTTIAGNLFARRCLPAQNAVCKPPHIN